MFKMEKENKTQEHFDREIPVKIGDILTLGVKRIGKSGDPVLIHEKFVIFLKGIEKTGVELNTMFKVKITKVLPHFAFCEKIK